ncbi:MAG TPA: hypothetical protein VGH19_16135 [Verrucomicrobiae bacterium]
MILADIVLPAEVVGILATGVAAWAVYVTKQIISIRMELHALKLTLTPKQQAAANVVPFPTV